MTSDQHFPFKFFSDNAFVSKIFPKLSGLLHSFYIVTSFPRVSYVLSHKTLWVTLEGKLVRGVTPSKTYRRRQYIVLKNELPPVI